VKRLSLLLAAAALICAAAARAEEPLLLESKIPLPDVAGRIDHMAIDLERQRLFIAELGNDSVGVVDLQQRKVLRTLLHLKEPQGVGYVRATDTLWVASALDGAVRLFNAANFAPAGIIELGQDADNIRVDAGGGKVFIGYGTGAIAVIDAASRARLADIALREHPEGFQLSPRGDRLFVNVPDARQIAVLDRAAGKQVAAWQMREAHANFPMALDADGARVIAVFRRPPRLTVYAASDGKVIASLEVCADADDVFADARRHRLYVSCGEGLVDVFERRDASYARIARVPTASGARTSLFVPELDRLFVGVRAGGGAPAALWLFRPAP
jgi:hypothetical protein